MDASLAGSAEDTPRAPSVFLVATMLLCGAIGLGIGSYAGWNILTGVPEGYDGRWAGLLSGSLSLVFVNAVGIAAQFERTRLAWLLLVLTGASLLWTMSILRGGTL